MTGRIQVRPDRMARLLAAWLCVSGLFACAQPAVLRGKLAEPVMPAPEGSLTPLPSVAVPTGEPAIERELGQRSAKQP